MARIRQVRRDDGTLVPFRERKIAEAVQEALQVAGTGDRALAEELAGVVLLFLEKYHSDQVPSVRDVEEMLLRVLRETGHDRAARVFEELQREQRRLREELSVRAAAGGHPGAGLPDDGDEVSAWDRNRLVRHLVERRELPDGLAEEVAASVEKRLIRSALRSVTASLVRELVDHDLVERGLEPASDQDRLAVVHRGDVQRVLRDDEGHGAPADRVIAAAALSRFALTDIHGESTARAHHSGRLHVHGLEDPLRLERLVVPASLLVPARGEDDLARSLLHLRHVLDALREHTRAEILLPDLAGMLAASAEARRDPAAWIERLLLALDFRNAYGRVSGPKPHIVVPLAAPADAPEGAAAFLRTLTEMLIGAPDSGERLSVTLAFGEDPLAAETAAALEGWLHAAASRPSTYVGFWRAGDPPLFSKGRMRPAPLRVSIARVALNLPFALLEGHDTELQPAIDRLREPAKLALNAFTERFWHQRQGFAQGLHGVVVKLGGPGQVQVTAQDQEVDFEVWGLSYGLELLVRRGLMRGPDRPRVAARILSLLDYVLGEEHNGVRFRVRLGGADDRALRRRFLEAIETTADRYGVGDMQALLREGLPERSTLPVVVPLTSPSNAALFASPFAERLAPGLALPLAAFGESDLASLFPRLRRDTRLGLLTLAPRRPGDDVFEVQEELF